MCKPKITWGYTQKPKTQILKKCIQKMEGKVNLSENGDENEEQGRMFLFFLLKNFST